MGQTPRPLPSRDFLMSAFSESRILRNCPMCTSRLANFLSAICRVSFQLLPSENAGGSGLRRGKNPVLRASDESDSLQGGGRIASVAPDRLGRLIDQPTPLVVADRLDVHARFLGEPTDRYSTDAACLSTFLLSGSGFTHYTRTRVRLP